METNFSTLVGSYLPQSVTHAFETEGLTCIVPDCGLKTGRTLSALAGRQSESNAMKS